MLSRRTLLRQVACSLGLALLPVWGGMIVEGAEPTVRKPKYGEFNPANETVEMFAGMKSEQLEVKLITKDSKQATVLIRNRTDKPINVELPEAFAGVPVLAQQLGGLGGGQAGGGQQGMGGGMGGMGGGGMGGGQQGGGGQGFFNVLPEKQAEFKVNVVCLEHGKKDPTGSTPYEIRPLEEFTTEPGVREVCAMLGRGQVTQTQAQAAAWHLNSHMSWQELASKIIIRGVSTRLPYFSPNDLQVAMRLTQVALNEAAKNAPATTSPGEEAAKSASKN